LANVSNVQVYWKEEGMKIDLEEGMKIDLVELYNDPNASLVLPVRGDELVRVLLENAQEQGFVIIPFVSDGKKQYSIVKKVDGEEVAFNPILEGDWLDGFPKIEEGKGEV
jgi:hypothetical protein